MKLLLVRHGQTDWNSSRRVQGRTDIGLNNKGIMQAKAVADFLCTKELNAVYSGPLARAFDTAKLIAAKSRIDHICIMEGLTEINFGAWEGKTDKELMNTYPKHWGDWNWVFCPDLCIEIGAESADEILQRARISIKAILNENPPNSTVAIVSHTMPIKLIAADLIGLPISRIRGIRADNCSTSVLELLPEGQATLNCWNDTSYLGGLL